MSVRTSSLVWEQSCHKGSRLLALLALADMCNNEGIAWPRVGTIAARIRVAERQTQYVLRDIERTGELYTHLQTGRTCPNFYLVATGLDAPSIENALTTFLLYPQDLAQFVAALLLKGQQGEDIRAELEELDQPFTAFFQIRRLIVAERKKAQRPAPLKAKAKRAQGNAPLTTEKEKAQRPAPLLATEEKRVQGPAPWGAENHVKGAAQCTHEPMNRKHETFVVEVVGELGDYLSSLLPWFIETAGLPLPDHNTPSGADEIQRRWVAPLQRLGQPSSFDVEAVKDLLLWGLNSADQGGWGDKVAAPGSLEKKIMAEMGRRTRERSRKTGQHHQQVLPAFLPSPQPISPESAVAHTCWEAVKTDLALQMTRETFNTWLQPTTGISQENGTLHVQVPNAYVLAWLENRLLATVERTATHNTDGAVQEVQFTIKPPANAGTKKGVS